MRHPEWQWLAGASPLLPFEHRHGQVCAPPRHLVEAFVDSWLTSETMLAKSQLERIGISPSTFYDWMERWVATGRMRTVLREIEHAETDPLKKQLFGLLRRAVG